MVGVWWRTRVVGGDLRYKSIGKHPSKQQCMRGQGVCMLMCRIGNISIWTAKGVCLRTRHADSFWKWAVDSRYV